MMNARILLERNSPIIIAAICFLIFIFSIGQIIELIKPTKTLTANYSATSQLYDTAYNMASAPNQNYKNFTMELSYKFPKIPEASVIVGITPEIANLPQQEQGSAIKQNVIESRLEFLEQQITLLTEEKNKNVLFNIWFYIWGFLAWFASIVFGSMLTHATNRFNHQYLSGWLDRWMPKTE